MIEVAKAKPIDSEITWQDLANPGPQVSFDLALGDRLPDGHELGFETEKYGAYLRSRGVGDAQVNTARLTFESASPLRLHRGSYDPRPQEMTVYVPNGASSKSLTRSVFHASEYFIRQQRGENVPRDYRDYANPCIGAGFATAAGVAELALRMKGIAGNAEILQSLTCVGLGCGAAVLSMLGVRLVHPPEIVRHARKAERRADGRPLVTIALKDAVEVEGAN